MGSICATHFHHQTVNSMQQNLKFKGELFEVREVKVAGEKNYPTREFIVLNVNEKNQTYNDYVVFKLAGASYCDIIDNFNLGDTIEVTFEVKGRRVETAKGVFYFPENGAWKVELVSKYAGKEPQKPKQQELVTDTDDDLPF